MIHLRRDADPQVSILVVAFNRRDRLERCLLSLERGVGRAIACETIVVLNHARREVREFFDNRVTGGISISTEVNVGFGAACNLGRRYAAGSLLVLLNDDTEIEEGWLEQLVATADAHPEAGAVGSAVLFPDGSLQEAGSIIWSDGSTTAVGRGHRGIESETDFVREVDYCSACSLLVRRSTWDAVGGMDEDYFPAYYEDCDLCMRIRRLGQRILYTPRSRVRHHEGSSSDGHARNFLIHRNQVRFRDVWAEDLADLEVPLPDCPAAKARAIQRARRHPRRLLIIDDRLPDQRLGSGFSRMLEVIDDVTDNHAISFWGSVDASSTSDVMRHVGVRVVDGSLDAHLATPEVLYDAVLISRPHNFAQHADTVRRRQPHAAVVYDAEALYHRRIERRLSLERDERAAFVLAATSRRMREIEGSIRSQTQALVTISDLEAAFFEASPGGCPIATIRPALPWARLTAPPFDDRMEVVFVAGWLAGSESPNGDGLKWFVDTIWPVVLATVPWARLRITGEAPADIRHRMTHASIEFTGLLADLHELYERARVAVVPLRYGAGISIKGTEALKFGVPVVTTVLGSTDLDALAPGGAWIADGSLSFADAVIALLTNRHAWQARRDAILRAAKRDSMSVRGQWGAVLDAAQLARTPGLVADRVQPGRDGLSRDAIAGFVPVGILG